MTKEGQGFRHPGLCRVLSGCHWGQGVGLWEQGWATLTSGDGGGDVDLGDSERCEGEELVRATG